MPLSFWTFLPKWKVQNDLSSSSPFLLLLLLSWRLIVHIFCIFIIIFSYLFSNKLCYLIFFLFNGVHILINGEGEKMNTKSPFNLDVKGYNLQLRIENICWRSKEIRAILNENQMATKQGDLLGQKIRPNGQIQATQMRARDLIPSSSAVSPLYFSYKYHQMQKANGRNLRLGFCF